MLADPVIKSREKEQARPTEELERLSGLERRKFEVVALWIMTIEKALGSLICFQTLSIKERIGKLGFFKILIGVLRRLLTPLRQLKAPLHVKKYTLKLQVIGSSGCAPPGRSLISLHVTPFNTYINPNPSDQTWGKKLFLYFDWPLRRPISEML